MYMYMFLCVCMCVTICKDCPHMGAKRIFKW